MELIKTTPRGDMDVELHISYSQLNTFLTCSFKYAHRYVWGTKPETKPMALVFGRAIHRAVEEYYLHLKQHGTVMPLEQMVAVFDDTFKAEHDLTEEELTFKKGESYASLRDKGIELVMIFYDHIHPQTIVDVEYPFGVSVPDLVGGGWLPIRLVGVFDLIESDAAGNNLVGELKTSAQKYSNQHLDFDLQATVYSYAMTQMKLALKPQSCLVRYDVLLKTKKPSLERYFVTRNEADHRRMIHLVNEVLRAINQRIFYRNTGWQCGDCQYKKACLS